MNRLILLRHGDAQPESPTGDDFDRSLSAIGRAESAAMGQYLAGLGLVPDVVLVSSARRTRETWAEIAADLGNAAVCFEARLYLADAATITQALSDRHGTVLVIGHNPGLQELGLSLLYAGHAPVSAISRLQTGLPTSGAAVFLIDDEQRPSYDGLFYPRDIR